MYSSSQLIWSFQVLRIIIYQHTTQDASYNPSRFALLPIFFKGAVHTLRIASSTKIITPILFHPGIPSFFLYSNQGVEFMLLAACEVDRRYFTLSDGFRYEDVFDA